MQTENETILVSGAMSDEREKITVKIFVPEALQRSETAAEKEYLFGRIVFDEITGINVFVISRSENGADAAAEGNDFNVVGEVANGNARTHLKKNYCGRDIVLFERDSSDATRKLRLSSVSFPSFDLSNYNGLKVQLILYDTDQFSHLTISGDASSDPILRLVNFIQKNKQSPAKENASQSHLIMTVLSILTFLSNKILNFNESVFLRHFSIWSNSLHHFTFKR